MDHRSRIRALQKELIARKIDAAFIAHGPNVRYLSGFTGHDGFLFITRKSCVFLTDARSLEEVREHLDPFLAVRLWTGSIFETIGNLAAQKRVRSVGFEAAHLPYAWAIRLQKAVGRIRTVDTIDLVEELRMVKDRDELRLIRRSIALCRKVFERIAADIKPGVSEAAIARSIEMAFLRHGARPSFNSIVASGANASKPHSRPGPAKIRANGFAMIDLGCELDGYASDITRMIITGRVERRFRAIYSVVQTAQELAIAAVRPGAPIADVDHAARRHIERSGYGKHFTHSLGHGVGLEVHEKPTVSPHATGALKEGMVFTIEPAIYLKGFGGVRIEDMVIVTKNGCEVLTR